MNRLFGEVFRTVVAASQQTSLCTLMYPTGPLLPEQAGRFATNLFKSPIDRTEHLQRTTSICSPVQL